MAARSRLESGLAHAQSFDYHTDHVTMLAPGTSSPCTMQILRDTGAWAMTKAAYPKI